jgi:hypothetical protein
MNEMNLRRWHRLTEAVAAPLIILQAVSGVFLSVDWLLGIHNRFGEAIRENVPPLARFWDALLVEIHYGLGKAGTVYHMALGIAVIWVAVSGFVIILHIRRRQRGISRKDEDQKAA